MLGKPLGQLFSCDEAGGKVEHEALLLIDARDDLREPFSMKNASIAAWATCLLPSRNG